MNLPEKLAFVDIETTGLGPEHDRIIEIGILRVENGKLIKSYQTLINPQTQISPFISTMTGITKQSLENAPLFEDVKEQILEMLEDCVFVAHNVRFDYGFVKQELRRSGLRFNAKHLCTVKLSRYLFPEERKHNLDSVMERFSILCENRHRAFDDAAVLWEFYKKAQKQFDSVKFLEAVDKALLRPALPTQLSHDTVDTLPESPGVYIFYGPEQSVLYIGKSINIKDRVLSHFMNDHSSSKEMKISQQIVDIEVVQTIGELGALLRESKMIKDMQPFYNRQLRAKKQLVLLKTQKNSEGYEEVYMNTVNEISLNDLPTIVGIFKSKRQAKEYLISLLKSYSLCEKLLGLEKTNGECFSYALGNCKGACLKKELPIMYNIRVLMAFSSDKIKPWPFPGPIIFKEIDILEQKEEAFIIDKWCLLGSVETSDLGSIGKALNQDYLFDVDTYKILHQFLTNKKYQPNITMLNNDTIRTLLSTAQDY